MDSTMRTPHMLAKLYKLGINVSLAPRNAPAITIDAAKNGSANASIRSTCTPIISPVGEIYYKGEKHVINNFEIGEVSQKLYDNLTGIQWGRLPDPHGWTHEVK